MEKRLQNRLFGCIRQVVSALERAESDRELLQRFVGQGDEAAFAAVVRRHGPMVLRVALRTLQNEHDAEDVFQATFLVLSQKAYTLRRQESLGSWLYGIAYRLALKSKAAAGKSRNWGNRVAATPAVTPLAEITVQEAQTILDEELDRLPRKLREPLVLCCLEGLNRDEAARQIGCAASVLKGRLEQARDRLRQRLAARSLTLPCGLGAFLLLEGAGRASLPPALIGSTTKAAITIAAGKAAHAVVTAKVAALTEGVLRTTFLTKIKTAMVALIVGMMGLGGGVLTYRTLAAEGALPLPMEQEEKGEWKPDAPKAPKDKQEKEAFTAWGKEVGGLQAGLGYHPGQKRGYSHGETVKLVVRVRNVGKEEVKFQYLRQFFIEKPPAVTDGEGKPVRLGGLTRLGTHIPVEVNLAPGKEIELYEWEPELRPASARDNKKPLFFATLYGTGKFQIQYERVFGNSSSGSIKLDPKLSNLATGKLELEIKSDPPPAATEKKTPQKHEREGFIPWGNSTPDQHLPRLAAEQDKEGFTAWGKEVGGLQAGLGYHPGQKRAYSHGETVRLVIRVRNVGKEAVKFSYLQPFIEHAPIVTDGDGKSVPQPDKLYEIGERLPAQVELAPGKEIELHELKRELKPESESGSKRPRPEGRPHALYGTAKVSVQYLQVLGNPSMGHPGWKLDPALSMLDTGKLDLEIKSDPPATTEKK